jgi:uncharacterized protein YeaO (DUF488 family)
MIKLKNVFETPSIEDGKRVLISRLWPLDADVYCLRIDLWCKDLAPSYFLLEWFRDHSKDWAQFKERYAKELTDPNKQKLMDELALQSREENITLLYTNGSPERSAAGVIFESIQRLK